ncbi:MAG: hypothetical protein RR555_00520 [Bacteroidales bacterium]
MQDFCIQQATTNDIPAIKSIWRECFTTDESYLHNVFTYLFFLSEVYVYRAQTNNPQNASCCVPKTQVSNTKISDSNPTHISSHAPEITISSTSGTPGPILSTLFLIPITYKSALGENLHGQYLYGVATTEAARGQRLSIKLIQYISSLLKLRGESFLIARPANADLFDFYRALGLIREIPKGNFCLPPALAEILSHANLDHPQIPEASLLFNHIAQTYPNRFEWSPELLNYMLRIGEFDPYFKTTVACDASTSAHTPGSISLSDTSPATSITGSISCSDTPTALASASISSFPVAASVSSLPVAASVSSSPVAASVSSSPAPFALVKILNENISTNIHTNSFFNFPME